MKTLLFLLASAAAVAQQAQVSGLVRDASDAVMPQVQISIVNQDTGLRRSAQTNSAGLYAVSGIKPGVYKITARQPGFQTVTRLDIKLDVAQSARVDATVSTVINRQFVENLPMNGRSLQS